jgi:hypothetical protein
MAGHGAPPGAHLERHRSALQGQRFAALAAQHRRPRHARPFFELRQDPALLFAQEGLDVTPGRAQRRRHPQAAGVDGDAERAPAPPREAVFDQAAAQLDQQSAFCCSSIHASAR